jgi:hypothetical protein
MVSCRGENRGVNREYFPERRSQTHIEDDAKRREEQWMSKENKYTETTVNERRIPREMRETTENEFKKKKEQRRRRRRRRRRHTYPVESWWHPQ